MDSNNNLKNTIDIKNIEMPFIDIFQSNLENELIEIYSKYRTNFNKNIPLVLKDSFTKSAFNNEEFFPLLEYVIKDGKVSISDIKNVKKHYTDKKDTRYIDNYNIISKTLKWCKKNKLPVPNTTLYIWISDRFPWYVQKLDTFPIWVYARPKNIKMPIFPDNTFECLQLQEKYKGKCYDWDSIKQIVNSECKNNKKSSIIYFKGTPTTRRVSRIREDLKEYHKKFNIPIKILLDAWEVYEPVYKFCEYLYLLNLPGHYPWSNRLKYLFLMDSIVINVNVNTVNIDPEYTDPHYITLIDYIVDNKDYIEILYNYYRVGGKYINKTTKDRIDALQKKEFDLFTKNIY